MPMVGSLPRRPWAILAAGAAVLFSVGTVSTASADTPTASPGAGTVSVHRSCAVPQRVGEMACQSLVRDDVKSPKGILPQVTPNGYGPADLQSAYNLPSATGGADQTVAIVDAFDNPNAESDLAVYREQYGLPACTTANGCFKKIDQRGGSNYPPPDANWAGEIALDVDMVSATCPQCHILLVESDDNFDTNLYAAINKAVELGAKYVSNSWGGSEDPSQLQADESTFNHPGVVITASSGDGGYGVIYPSSSKYVTAVGGTALTRDSSARGWSESVWFNQYGGPGSGCSGFDPKPDFQGAVGTQCDNRAVADVSAVADPVTGVAVYNGGWAVYGGTSASSPIVASTYALAGTPVANTYPNAYPYAAPAGSLNDVTQGNNGSCTPAVWCTAGPGWDGPTGLGTPNGVNAFSTGPHGHVAGTVTDSGTGAALAGATVAVGDQSTTTDSSGNYSLTVPTGTYDVTASKYGYTSQTASGVAVADGASVAENFALAPIPQVNVTGLVRDSSGHGWPLYAAVQVKDVPSSKVFTDPSTGRYSISLPEGSTYTLQVTAQYPGYQTVTQDVVVGSGDVSQDLNVPVDTSTGSCLAPGYTQPGMSEHFDGTSTPASWTVVDNNSSGKNWAFNDPRPRGNLTGGSGHFAILDSDFYGPGVTEDSSLVSPLLDFTGKANPVLKFATDYFEFSNSTADVDVSVDGGATWSNVWRRTTANQRGPNTQTVDLAAAANKAGVQVRFHYTGAFAWWWQVDDVFLGDKSCQTVPGGLVVGQTLDKNTGEGVNGVSVKSADKPAEQATSAATPDDSALGDGFYWYFSSATGKHDVTASKSNYTTQTKSVNIAANWATKADFSLPAGQLTVTPGSVSKTVAWGGTATAKVTVKNTGSAPVTVKLSEQPGGFTLQDRPQGAGAPLQLVQGNYSPLRDGAQGKSWTRNNVSGQANAQPAAPPWTTVADYPSAVMDNAAIRGADGKIYSFGGTPNGNGPVAKSYVLDPASNAWSPIADLPEARQMPQLASYGGKIYVAGGWAGSSGAPTSHLAIYDPGSNSWSDGAASPKAYAAAGYSVLDGKLYSVGGCTASACGSTDVQVYDLASNTWSSAAAYPQSESWLACGGISGKLYCAGGTTDAGDTKNAYMYDPAADQWSQIAALPIDLWAMDYVNANGQLLVSGGVTNGANTLTNQGFAYDPASNTWTALPNSNNSLYRGASACGFYKVGGSSGQFAATTHAELLPGYDTCGLPPDVSWLSQSPTEFTLAPGASQAVTVTLDASGADITQPGTFTAGIGIGENTPYSYPAVPVSLTVKPPSTWGKITGTITGTACNGTATPIKGATVEIDSWAQNFTLKTDADGNYALWLDYRNNPLSVIAAKDGWAPQVKAASIKKLATTTLNFALKPDHSCT
jgi:N-acetylneuraminic acid mutarotase